MFCKYRDLAPIRVKLKLMDPPKIINRQLRNSYGDISQVVAFYIGHYNPLGEEVDPAIGPIETDSDRSNSDQDVSISRYILIGFKPDHFIFGHRSRLLYFESFQISDYGFIS